MDSFLSYPCNQILNTRIDQDDVLFAEMTGDDPFWILEDFQFKDKFLQVTMKVESDNIEKDNYYYCKLYFQEEGMSGFDEEHSLFLPIKGFNQYHTYIFTCVRLQRSNIIKIRFDPLNHTGTVHISKFQLTDHKPPTSEKVNQYWGNFFNKRQQKEGNKDKVLWLDSSIVKEYASNEYMDSKDYFLYWKEKYFPENGFKRGLELGCGSGLPSLVYSTVVQSLDAYDVSEESVNLAKKTASERGVTNINFQVADVNRIELPHNEYEAAFFSHSLHHIDALERVFPEVNKSLKPGGLVFIYDYVGPNRVQWKQREYAIMTAIDNILPDKYRKDSIHENRVRSEVEIIPLEAFEPDWPGGDPSEAVRSEDIISELRKVFEIVEERSLGGTILHGLLQGIVHNFDSEDECDTTILRLICLIEKLMIREAGLESYFKLIVARKRMD